MNYYQHHIGDFIRDTARLNDSQCMAYLRLLWMYYETEQPLECDIDALAFKIGANASDAHQIIKHFFFEHDGKWHHSRCDKEILAFREKSKKAKESASARWNNAKAMRTHDEEFDNAAGCERMRTHKNDCEDAQKLGEKHPNAMRTHTERNANERVFDANQEPVTNISSTNVEDRAPRRKGASRATQLPADFYPNENGIRYAEDRSVNVAIELQSMRNWYEAQQKPMKDWQAAWRTWCDKAVEFGRAGSGGKPSYKTARQINDEAVARSIFGITPSQSQGLLIDGEVLP